MCKNYYWEWQNLKSEVDLIIQNKLKVFVLYVEIWTIHHKISCSRSAAVVYWEVIWLIVHVNEVTKQTVEKAIGIVLNV